MQVAVFFTFDYSLKTWSNSGTIEREVEIYKKLKDEYGVEFIFLPMEIVQIILIKKYMIILRLYQYIPKLNIQIQK